VPVPDRIGPWIAEADQQMGRCPHQSGAGPEAKGRV
jgi:hypothetical protein